VDGDAIVLGDHRAHAQREVGERREQLVEVRAHAVRALRVDLAGDVVDPVGRPQSGHRLHVAPPQGFEVLGDHGGRHRMHAKALARACEGE
jgi:hypothetical protein